MSVSMSAAVAPEEQLAWEARAGRPAAAAAFLSALLGLGGVAYGNIALSSSKVNDDVDGAFLVHRHHAVLIGTSVLEALSVLLLAVAVAYLYRATRFRRAELRPQALWMTVGGAVVYAGALVGQQLALIDVEDRLVTQLTANPLAPKAANDLAKHALSHGKLATWALVQLALGIFLGAGVVLISLNARRAGILSSFMGIVGIIVGVLLVLPFFGRPPIVEYFWLVALGLLYLDRWPGGGRGPAWASGEAIPWPTAAEVRAAQASSGEGAPAPRGRAERPPPRPPPRWLERLTGRGAAASSDGGGDDEDPDETPEPQRAAAPQHPRSKKRKKKRRR
jgi:hypothetical protein